MPPDASAFEDAALEDGTVGAVIGVGAGAGVETDAAGAGLDDPQATAKSETAVKIRMNVIERRKVPPRVPFPRQRRG